MIRSNLLTLSKLTRPFSSRCLQTTTVYSRNYYVERNDDLLDIDKILKTENKMRANNREVNRDESSQDEIKTRKVSKSSSTKPFKSLKRSKIESKQSRLNSKDYMEAFFKTDPLVRQQFIEDFANQDYSNYLIIEGKNLINDVISYGYPKILRIYYSDDKKLEKLNQLGKLKEEGVEFMKVEYGIMKEHSDVLTPQGLAAVIKLNINELFRLNSNKIEKALPLTVVTAGLSDNGNMGTLVRSSLACGVEKFLCLKKCAQLLKSKVIRSSAGSVFQIPFIENIDVRDLKNHLPENCTIYVADSNLNLLDYVLNGGNEEGNDLKGNSSRTFLDTLPALNYTDVDYFSKPNNSLCLVIGGESGLSPDFIESFCKSNCTRLNIPMLNNVDSLNTSIAGSLIMYEMKRQFINKSS